VAPCSSQSYNITSRSPASNLLAIIISGNQNRKYSFA
jgi:hypothetical protein